MSQDESLWNEFRRQMPIVERFAYFDHAAVSPLPLTARAAIENWVRQASDEGDTAWPAWSKRLEQVRATAAYMMGARPEEVALIRSTTEGINLVAEGYPWQPGDNVVTLADEFPSNLYPWMNLASRGVETRLVKTDAGRVDPQRLADACDSRTRIVSTSWVGFSSGWRNDVAALARVAHDRGALFFLDAIQGLGVFPLDVQAADVDFLAADGHKWLLGPEGAGLFYIKHSLLDTLRPLGVGWSSVQNSHDYSHIELRLKPTAARYEGGTMNTAGFLALGASLDLLMQYGQASIAERILEITDFACQRLTEVGAVVTSPRDAGHRSGIVSFEMPGREPQAVRLKCIAQNVILSCRLGRLRLAAHAYNNRDDVERLVAALA